MDSLLLVDLKVKSLFSKKSMKKKLRDDFFKVSGAKGSDVYTFTFEFHIQIVFLDVAMSRDTS